MILVDSVIPLVFRHLKFYLNLGSHHGKKG